MPSDINIICDGVDDFVRELRGADGVSPEKIAATTALALNGVGYELRRRMQAEFGRVFRDPVEATLRAPRVVEATAQQLTTTVKPTLQTVTTAPTPGRQTDPQQWLAAEEAGGPRRDKKSEALLRQRGWLPTGCQSVIPADPWPGSTDGHGNLSGRFVQQLLAYLWAFPEQGSRANMRSKKTRAKFTQDGQRQFFIGYGNTRPGQKELSHLPPGVWGRTAAGALRPVLLFVRAPRYRARLDVQRLQTEAGLQALVDKNMSYWFRRSLGLMQ